LSRAPGVFLFIMELYDLQKQFKVTRNDEVEEFLFQAQTNDTTSYAIHFSECDADEANAWISISLAVKRSYPNLNIA